MGRGESEAMARSGTLLCILAVSAVLGVSAALDGEVVMLSESEMNEAGADTPEPVEKQAQDQKLAVEMQAAKEKKDLQQEEKQVQQEQVQQDQKLEAIEEKKKKKLEKIEQKEKEMTKEAKKTLDKA